MLTAEQLHIYNNLIRNIYLSSNLQELRINVLTDLQALVPYHNAVFFLVDPQTLEFSEPLFYGLDSSSLTTYNNLCDKDRKSAFAQANFTFVNRNSVYLNHDLQGQNDDGTDFLLPQGIYFIASIQIFHQGLLRGEISLHRKQEQADFSDEEMLILKLLYEHINERFSNLYTLLRSSQTEKSELFLTKREAQIASLITHGKSNKQIALDLGVSENTIKTFLKRIFNKMGVHSRSELIIELYRSIPSGNYTYK